MGRGSTEQSAANGHSACWIESIAMLQVAQTEGGFDRRAGGQIWPAERAADRGESLQLAVVSLAAGAVRHREGAAPRRAQAGRGAALHRERAVARAPRPTSKTKRPKAHHKRR